GFCTVCNRTGLIHAVFLMHTMYVRGQHYQCFRVELRNEWAHIRRASGNQNALGVLDCLMAFIPECLRGKLLKLRLKFFLLLVLLSGTGSLTGFIHRHGALFSSSEHSFEL